MSKLSKNSKSTKTESKNKKSEKESSNKTSKESSKNKKIDRNSPFIKGLLATVHDSIDSFYYRNFKLEEQPFFGSYEAAFYTIDTLIDGVIENLRLREQDGKKVPFAAEYTLIISDMIL